MLSVSGVTLAIRQPDGTASGKQILGFKRVPLEVSRPGVFHDFERESGAISNSESSIGCLLRDLARRYGGIFVPLRDGAEWFGMTPYGRFLANGYGGFADGVMAVVSAGYVDSFFGKALGANQTSALYQGARITGTVITGIAAAMLANEYCAAAAVIELIGAIDMMRAYSEGNYLEGTLALVGVAAGVAHLRRMKGCFLAGTKVLTDSGRKNIEDIQVGDLVLSRDDKTGEQGFKRVARLFRGKTDQVVHLRIVRKAGLESESAADQRVDRKAGHASRPRIERKAPNRDARSSGKGPHLEATRARPAPAGALAKLRVRGRTARRSHASSRPRRATSSSTDDGDGSGSADAGHAPDSAEEGDDPDPSRASEGSSAPLSPRSSLARSASLRCTTEHPFFVRGRGWVGAGRLEVGDELISDRGELLLVVAAETRREPADHFNFEVEDWHTYFVAETEADPGVWVHNKCGGRRINGRLKKLTSAQRARGAAKRARRAKSRLRNWKGEPVQTHPGHEWSPVDPDISASPIFDPGPFTKAQRDTFLSGRSGVPGLAPHHRHQLPVTRGGVIDEIPGPGHAAGNIHTAGSPARHAGASYFRNVPGGARLRKSEIRAHWRGKGNRLQQIPGGLWVDPGP